MFCSFNPCYHGETLSKPEKAFKFNWVDLAALVAAVGGATLALVASLKIGSLTSAYIACGGVGLILLGEFVYKICSYILSKKPRIINPALSEAIRKTPKYGRDIEKYKVSQKTHQHEIWNGIHLGDLTAFERLHPKHSERLPFADEVGFVATITPLWLDQNPRARELVEEKKLNADHVYLPHVETWEKIKPHLEEIFRRIDKALNEGKKVLIHCTCGVNKSPTVLCAYFMNRCRVPYQQAANFIRSKRMQVAPMRKELEAYQKELGIKDLQMGDQALLSQGENPETQDK